MPRVESLRNAPYKYFKAIKSTINSIIRYLMPRRWLRYWFLACLVFVVVFVYYIKLDKWTDISHENLCKFNVHKEMKMTSSKEIPLTAIIEFYINKQVDGIASIIDGVYKDDKYESKMKNSLSNLSDPIFEKFLITLLVVLVAFILHGLGHVCAELKLKRPLERDLYDVKTRFTRLLDYGLSSINATSEDDQTKNLSGIQYYKLLSIMTNHYSKILENDNASLGIMLVFKGNMTDLKELYEKEKNELESTFADWNNLSDCGKEKDVRNIVYRVFICNNEEWVKGDNESNVWYDEEFKHVPKCHLNKNDKQLKDIIAQYDKKNDLEFVVFQCTFSAYQDKPRQLQSQTYCVGSMKDDLIYLLLDQVQIGHRYTIFEKTFNRIKV